MIYTEKKWNIAYDGSDEDKNQIVKRLTEELGISALSAIALCNRGYTNAEDAESFIRNDTVILHDPFLLPNMKKACDIIINAVDSKEKIVIYGDYDADGVTATTLLYKYFKSKNADIHYYIPDRKTEGYGMNIASVERLWREGAQLIVTVDNGITAINEIARAKELGMKVVVTDHHSCHEELPDADATVDPWMTESEYPFCELAGVGVAFKTVCAIETLLCEREERDIAEAITALCIAYTELVCIGTVADVMPLRDENRLLCAMGLHMIKEAPSLGTDALMYAASLGETVSAADSDSYVNRPREVSKRKINASYIGFVIAPRINAAGRVTHAFDAVDLLLSENKKDAMRSAFHLCDVNTTRKSLENVISETVISDISQGGEPEHKIIVLASDEWQNGVVGIVASRITEKYGLPVVLVSFEDSIVNGKPDPLDVGKGSCRSVPGFDIHAALDSCADLFVRYGGHELAAGLTIYRKDFEEFQRRVSEYADSVFNEDDAVPTIDIDCVADISDIDIAAVNELSAFEPYGTGNPQPIFASLDITVEQLSPLSQGRYAKFVAQKDGNTAAAISFIYAYDELPVYNGELADIAYTVDINQYKGISTPQLVLKDVRLSRGYVADLKYKHELLRRFADGEDVVFPGEFEPDRRLFASVYNYVRSVVSGGFPDVSLRRATSVIRNSGFSRLEPWQTDFALCVFAELGLLKVERINDDVRAGALPTEAKRAELSSSTLLYRYNQTNKINRNQA